MRGKRHIAVLSILVLAVALVPAVVMAADDTTSGQFTVGNSAPTIGTISIDDNPMTPQAEWTVITVPVTDINGLSDVDDVDVTVFYDSGGTDPAAPGSAHYQTCAILSWDRGSGWSIDDGTGTTWAIDSGNCSAGSDSLTQDDWDFSFKVGKVATESPGSDDWDIYGNAIDSTTANGSDYLRDVEMNWYGEITVNGSVDWGTVSAGDDFTANSPEVVTSVDYIANGAYDEQVASSSTWSGATLNVSGTPLTDEFSLKADDTATYASSVLVDASPTYTAIDTSGTQTDEDGDSVTTNNLWLKLGAPFTAATYSGTIYYRIADGS